MVREKENLFISRELSWLDFNARVLDEASCAANPVLERLKFIAITSGNLDEFFMVRIAGLRKLVRSGRDIPDPAGLRPSEQLEKARPKIMKLIQRQQDYLQNHILPELEQHNIRLRKVAGLPPEIQKNLRSYFERRIKPVLTPLVVDSGHPFPILNSGTIEIALLLEAEDKKEKLHGFVEVPDVLERFIQINDGLPGKTFAALEDIISSNLDLLFSGKVRILEHFPFRITRDMNFSITDEGVEDLLQSIAGQLKRHRQRAAIRLETCGAGKGKLYNWLKKSLALESLFCYDIKGFLHTKQFFELVQQVNLPELQEAPWEPCTPPGLPDGVPVFDAVKAAKNILIAPPFQHFSPIVRLLEESAEDPDVLAIKQTLYRVSGNSPVVHALQRAAENGKQVTVVVELKARFDERNNIAWARALEESGAHVIYGVAGLKVHCKALLIVRKEADSITRCVHLATGNYNDKTAAAYTDMGILSTDPQLCFEVADLFNLLTGYTAPGNDWQLLGVAPFTLRERFTALVEREIRFAQAGHPARIIAKMNSFSDEKMIRLIHRAADAGVKIDLVVRGICCFRPRREQRNVRIISIVDRYLEHSRIFIFHNGGNREFYLASADWMTRNLDRRIELLFPVRDLKLQEILDKVMTFQLNDTDKARKLLSSGIYQGKSPASYSAGRSQKRTWQYFRELGRARQHSGNLLKVYTSPEEQKNNSISG